MIKKASETKKEGLAGIDPKTMRGDILKLIRLSFEIVFGNVVKIQEFNEKMLRDILDESKEMHLDAVLIVDEVIENATKGRNEYRRVIEEGFRKMEDTLHHKIPPYPFFTKS